MSVDEMINNCINQSDYRDEYKRKMLDRISELKNSNDELDNLIAELDQKGYFKAS